MKQRAITTISTVDGRVVRCRVVHPANPAGSPTAIGLPLLLIHGFACSAAVWEPALGCLERQRLDQPVIAPDMAGYGYSAAPPAVLGIDELADWAARLLDALGVARTHVAGHSMGCQVALAVAQRHPARVGSLVLVGPTVGRETIALPRYLVGLLRDMVRESLRYDLTVLRSYFQMGFLRSLATVGKMLADDPLARAGGVTAPCLIVRGTRDPIVSEALARRLAGALPSGHYTAVEGAAHAAQFSRSEAFTRAALDFLARVPETAELPRS
jgi:pimeloyl-ACP methyl ester carboxylesterase